jgi:hypothetical protein
MRAVCGVVEGGRMKMGFPLIVAYKRRKEIEMDINRELAELLGVPRHKIVKWGDECRRWTFCSCGKRFKSHSAARIHARNLNNFTSSDGKIELLRLMMKREGWMDFLKSIRMIEKYIDIDFFITHYLTNKTGLLAQAAYCFLKNKA